MTFSKKLKRDLRTLFSLAFCISAISVPLQGQDASSKILAQQKPPTQTSSLSVRKHPALPAYDALDDFGQWYFPAEIYKAAQTQTEFDILDFDYLSDGVSVPGLMLRPKNLGDKKWPVIFYQRGGTGDSERILGTGPCTRANSGCLEIVDLYLLAKSGFIVLASDYHFHGATSALDEWDGKDLDDVMNLITVSQALPYVKSQQFFMLGSSRGGTMTYLALKRHAPVRAAAVIAAPLDLEAWGKYQPEFVTGDETYKGWANLWPDFAHWSAELYRERSAVNWTDQIIAPVLIFHSRADKLVLSNSHFGWPQACRQRGESSHCISMQTIGTLFF